jgi:DNA-binding response OmpR family regulator
MAQGEVSVGPQPRVLLAAAADADLFGVPEYLADQGCLVIRCAQTDDVGRQAMVLTPHAAIVAETALLELLDRCRAVRAATQAPLLVLGQRDLESDEVLCLEYGADSFLAPGASPRRVRAYLQALLRRGLNALRMETEQPLRFGDLRVDARRRRVYRGEMEIELSQKEYALLIFLVEHAGQTVTRQALADYVWGSSMIGESRSLDVHIHWLREKLEADAGNPQHIRTVRGVGYCFEP